jgi:radical SAM superfamily enzyme YgiQ (UPF0313 family)
VQHKGALLAGPLSGVFQPVPLAEPDVALLFAFLGGAAPAAATERIRTGDLARFVPGRPPAAVILGRIEQFRQARLLVEGSQQLGSATMAPAAPSGGAPPAAAPMERAVRLGRNFALKPARDGFSVWSARHRSNFLLDAELALLLCAFRKSRPVGEVLSGFSGGGAVPRLAAAAVWMLDAGLLVESRALPAELLPGHDAAGAAPLRIAQPRTGRWTDLAPDGRIPVYFTPHMENHFPLALGMMFAAIEAHAGGALLHRFQLLPITYLEPQQLLEGPFRKFGPGVWLFSNYMWSLEVNLRISNFVKSRDARNLTIHGGPSTPEYREVCGKFMANNPSVDIAVHGEGEMAVIDILERVARGPDGAIRYGKALQEVHGLTFRAPGDGPGDLHRTPPRLRMREPGCIPSPYTTGVFDAYDGRVEAAIIESNRGCPFGCTFCDWGSATRQKVRKFDLERVKQEIEWIGQHGIRVLWIADANFGMYDRDIEVAKYIVDAKARLGFPREVVVNYTKNTTRRLIEIIKAFSAGGIISQGIISIQTTDEATLEVINRKNIKTETYDELAQHFAAANLPLSTDLMIGLPGITAQAFDRDLQRYFDADVTVKAYPTQLLPNSPMADPDYLRKYRIEVDEDDFVVACHSFTRAELGQMKAVYRAFELADGYSTLRYVLRHLQWDHGIQSLDFLHRLSDTVRRQPERYPRITWAIRFFVMEKSMPGGWHGFYEEIARLAAEAFGVERDSALETALLVNELAMPDDGLAYPVSAKLHHDFVRYFQDHSGDADAPKAPLADYPPADFTVDDPDLLAHIDLEYLQYDSHQYFWEIRSAIARPKSATELR